ncbi:MAG: bifunctional methylenetetrahydrofolate dehydrogenase/methenyltetrahydrofolate cyclohydrolase FolD [Xanthomonadales bacterium]|nr:bifunctional methylenetetrahydrofolate dehydrogenase/methenyltetrahydrofolate cyclohydrolase FolD [Xanthomonadales bacterium]
MASIIDGKARAQQLRQSVAEKTRELKDRTGVTPGLAVVIVGDDPASQVYVRNKGKQALEAGFESFTHTLPAETTEAALLDLVDQLNRDDRVHGILVQLPLPDHIDEQRVINRISPDKDVDGFHVENVGKLVIGADGFVPCTPLGCWMMIRESVESLSGLNAVIVGRSNIVGKPMAFLLLREHCTVTIAHSRTQALDELCRSADILVAAVGRPGIIQGDWVKPGAVVIDVGINRVTDDSGKSRLTGDVDFDGAVERAGHITPVPGGVGPMTIACLLSNTLKSATRAAGQE